MMRALVTLCPAESKRLIARAVARLPEVREALDAGVLVIGTGSTNADVVEACTGRAVDRSRFIAGMIVRGATCVTPRDERKPNLVLVEGEARDITPTEALDLPLEPKVLIKGANAVDPTGLAGVLMAAADGGTIGRLIGRLQAGGWPIVVPVGLEKMIPSVRDAAAVLGHAALDRSLGARVGLMPIASHFVITEVQAFRLLAGVACVPVAAGGLAGSEGAITLVVEGEEAHVDVALEAVEAVKGASSPRPALSTCATCTMRCDYAGISNEDLPGSLRT